jgi:hypothetical protein
MQNHEQKKKAKKVKNQDSMGQTNFFLSTLPHLGNFNYMATCRSFLKPVLNKTPPGAHIELELDVLGVPRKVVKYVVHLSTRKN